MSWRNDLVRAFALRAIPLLAAWFHHRFERRIDRHAADQAALRERYGIATGTPIRPYDELTRAAILALASSRPEVRLAYTSGSTSEPKALAYPPERLASFRQDSRSVGVRAWARYGLRQPSIFVLSSLALDASFASLVVHQAREPSLITGLIEPARYLFQPAAAERIERYGATAVRLWLMLLSDPGLIYSTNPSTLAVFLSEVHDDWPRATAMVRDWVAGDPRAVDAGTRRIASRVAAGGSERRLRLVAAASTPPPISTWLPGLGAYCCWDGGYVTAFLRQIHRWLPPERYVHIPMYAMSTETIETLTWLGDDGPPRFLPLGPGVLYELLPEAAPDAPEHLLRTDQAEVGQTYALVVSDPWGLRRYQTEDLFLCAGHVRGVPDLRFQRRRGLTWSFTGEKLTGEQLSEAYARLEAEVPALVTVAAQLTLLPSWPDAEALPRYHLVVAHPGQRPAAPLDADLLSCRLDELLAGINEEYRAKRTSQRLAPPVAHVLPYDTVAEHLDAARTGGSTGNARGWDSQFKLMPLTRRLWEETGLVKPGSPQPADV
jgi:hypothetical protein